jgi:hypothetical protein
MANQRPYELRFWESQGVWVCFGKGGQRPDAWMEELERELARRWVGGEVVLDALAANGAGAGRFFRLGFDGERLSWLSAKRAKVESFAPDFLKGCDEFYKERPEWLDGGALSSEARQKFLDASS